MGPTWSPSGADRTQVGPINFAIWEPMKFRDISRHFMCWLLDLFAANSVGYLKIWKQFQQVWWTPPNNGNFPSWCQLYKLQYISWSIKNSIKYAYWFVVYCLVVVISSSIVDSCHIFTHDLPGGCADYPYRMEPLLPTWFNFKPSMDK